MLIQFSFKNFKSFKDEAILDLSATKMTEFSNRIFSVGSEKILPVAVIYGANAGGKSNIYSAFVCMSKFVIRSFSFGDDAKAFDNARPVPFVFSDDTKDAETSFEVYFTIPGDERQKVYNYGFCVDGEGITEEWLNIKAKTARKASKVFYRDKETLDLSGLPKDSRRNIETALEKQVLIVSLGAKLKDERCKQIRDWFINNEFADFADLAMNIIRYRRLPKGFGDDPKVRADVVNYLSSFDGTIRGFRVEKIPSEGENERKIKCKVYTIHKMIDSDKISEIPLEAESAGTLKMLALYSDMQEVLKKGAVYFIDELNARLHPLLVRNFVLTFLNPSINTNHAQLVFTIHDTWLLSNRLFRRDEVWFTKKDAQGCSTLYSLADIVDEDGEHIRKDESYEKNYLLGKYGAIPTLKSIRPVMEE